MFLQVNSKVQMLCNRINQIISLQLRKCCSLSQTITVNEALKTKPVNQTIIVRGWVQSVREYKNIHFVDLIDGTCFNRLQVIIDANKYVKPPVYGSSIKVEGCIVKSLHQGQEIEMMANTWEQFGECADDYPFICHQKFSQEYIRQLVHLRPKTRHFSSILRIRNRASMAVHDFFQKEGYCFVHTPIITQNDCEGAGEVFSVDVRKKLDGKGKTSSGTCLTEKVEDCNTQNTQEGLSLETDEFFGAPTYLTVSGQLHLEAITGAFARAYNFGPTFRAESSQTRLHASEFQMIEAEIAFAESIDELLKVVEKCVKSVTVSLLEFCNDDINFLSKDLKNHKEYMDSLISKSFVQMTYDEAINILEQNRRKLKGPIKYGDDLATNHKQFLVKHCNNIPVFVSMFPSAIKPFYMKSDQNKMAFCFDLFASYGGEICGGSLREDKEENLKEKFPFDDNSSLLWYLDLRKYGSVPHGGFGIGFERLLQSILGIPNIRDIIPFPRRKWDCKC